jgi:hypothetical protein
MTAVPSIDPARFLNEHLAQASPYLMRELLTTFIQTLWSADADAVCGVAPTGPWPGRTPAAGVRCQSIQSNGAVLRGAARPDCGVCTWRNSV